MTRENLIFLGACSLMSSHIGNFERGNTPMSNAIDWATKIYDRVHGAPGMAETAPEQWEVQCFFDDAQRWARSRNKFIDQTFDNYKGAYEAMKEWGSAGMEYRVVKL